LLRLGILKPAENSVMVTNRSAGRRRKTWLGVSVSLADAEARIAAQEAQLIAQIANGDIEGPMRELPVLQT
jgi:hypothetical protein